MFRCTLVAFLLLGACGGEGPKDAGPSDVINADSDGGATSDAGADAETLDAFALPDVADLGVQTCAPEDETPWYADCDGDGLAASGATSELACRAPSHVPIECGGAGEWTSTAPTTPTDSDCRDSDPSASIDTNWWPDCDGDEVPADAEPVVSCGPPGSGPSSCGLGEVGGWSLANPAGGVDCDDHDRGQGLPVTWYVDCDRDGFAPEGFGTTSSCTAPEASPVPCGDVGGWTDVQPSAAPRSTNNRTTDCNDEDAFVFPGQMEFMIEPSPGLGSTAGFDYNCDGIVSPQFAGVYSCSVSRTGPNMFMCIRPTGELWFASIPGCGEVGDLVSGCSLTNMGSSCRPATTRTATQACR